MANFRSFVLVEDEEFTWIGLRDARSSPFINRPLRISLPHRRFLSPLNFHGRLRVAVAGESRQRPGRIGGLLGAPTIRRTAPLAGDTLEAPLDGR